MFSLSLAVYVAGQFEWVQKLQAGWFFQPYCWQFLMLIAAVLGMQFAATGRIAIPKWGRHFAVALAIVVIGLGCQDSKLDANFRLKPPMVLGNRIGDHCVACIIFPSLTLCSICIL